MGTIITYVMEARDSFADRPLCRVDSLVFSWLAYLRFHHMEEACDDGGVALSAFDDAAARMRVVQGVHDERQTSLLLAALATASRFRDVRVVRHVAESSDSDGLQFSATTFALPDGQGSYIAFRGTDDTLTGWKENLHLATNTPIPSQIRARDYLEAGASSSSCPVWVGGHSKGGVLAVYACATAANDARRFVAGCFSHDGPGVGTLARSVEGWHDDVPVDKTVTSESLVGMLFERSQADVIVVRSSGEGFFQHDPFTWEVCGNDFACRHGVTYDVWRLAQRLNDWLDGMEPAEREEFVDLVAWLADATGERTFSGLIRRWPSNRKAMKAALTGATEEECALFGRVMEDLLATVLLGSAQEYAPVGEAPQERANDAQRRIEDLSAHMNDRLDMLDRYAGL